MRKRTKANSREDNKKTSGGVTAREAALNEAAMKAMINELCAMCMALGAYNMYVPFTPFQFTPIQYNEPKMP